jgi:Peptidase family M1 domain
LKRILAIAEPRTYVTKVPATRRRAGLILAVCLAVLPIRSAFGCQANPGQATPAEIPSEQIHRPGPAESVYLQLSDVGLDPKRVFRVREASLGRSAIHITLEDGTIAFTKDVLGRITGAFFEGYGELLLAPPNDVERKSMSLFTSMAILEERFSTAYFRFNDNTATELQPGLRAPEDADKFIAQWDQTARNLAHADAMRLLASFSGMLPVANGAISEGPGPLRAPDSGDRMLHARLQGDKLGVFDIFFDSTAGEQIEAGQIKTGEDGNQYYDIWASFSIENAGHHQPSRKQTVQTLPAEMESQGDPIFVRSYVIDAHVKPPKQLDAEVEMHLDAVRGGSRFLEFELSRFLQIQTVEADGRSVEFIQNPALEGSRLARSGNDVVAVILPEPARKGQRISLRFVYGGEVLAEAGRGLLYVGARGTWYPNRGMAMADFDLTFHYPPGWTLLATGKPAPLSRPSTQPLQTPPQGAGEEQAAHWVSERPIPVAGFNLGKYVRGTAQAGDVTVDTYATIGVERDFPKPPPPTVQPDAPSLQPGSIVPTPIIPLLAPPLAPSPARTATAVAEVTARAIRYYADRFGPFPYSQLALTQLPGRDSQGWPGLIFLSSYAFLTSEESKELHVTPVQALLGQLIPAHEAAHQWWGDLITWATYRDQWFSEGLASYCSLMALQEKNPAGFRLVMEKYQNDLAEKNKDGNFLKDAGPVTLGNRLLSSHFPEGYEAISYGRGTWLFHMLRSMMQDAADDAQRKDPSLRGVEEPFMRSLRKFRERYAGKTVSTRELLEVFAEDLPPSLRYEGKASLDWFLEGWVNGTSLPRLELQGVKFTAKANVIVVTGVIRQKNAPEDLVTSVPIYAMVSGKAPVLLGRVFADGAETSFHLSAPIGAHKLLLDPNGTILTSPK